MASDPRIVTALAALAVPIATFRAAIAGALGRANALLVSDVADRARVELGDFARGRLNPDAFAALAARSALDGAARSRIERAARVLRALASADDSIFVVDVPRAGDLRREVAVALGRLGCAFGARRALDTARSGRFDTAHHDDLLDLWPFEYWTKAEREVAPPLVVTIDGADLHAPGLTEFMDGAVRIVLVVRGPCTPAPLARVVTPGVLIVQSDGKGLEVVARSGGPAIAALLEGDAAHFVHDPSAGRDVWQRLTVSRRPTADPRSAVGRWSAWQQRDELRHLGGLVQAPSLPEITVAAAIGANGADPAERLATWLLEQAQLDATPRG